MLIYRVLLDPKLILMAVKDQPLSLYLKEAVARSPQALPGRVKLLNSTQPNRLVSAEVAVFALSRKDTCTASQQAVKNLC